MYSSSDRIYMVGNIIKMEGKNAPRDQRVLDIFTLMPRIQNKFKAA